MSNGCRRIISFGHIDIWLKYKYFSKMQKYVFFLRLFKNAVFFSIMVFGNMRFL